MNNFETLISGNKPVLVDFYADWCRPCQMMAPILEDVKSQIGDQATIIKINVDENQALAAQYGIQSIPSLLIFKQAKNACVNLDEAYCPPELAARSACIKGDIGAVLEQL